MSLTFSGLKKATGRYGNTLWYISFILLLIPVYLGFFDATKVPGLKICLLLGSAAAYALLCLKIYFLDGHSTRQLLAYTGILILVGFGVVFSGTRSLLSVFLLTFGAKDVPFRNITKLSLGFFSGILVLNCLLVLTGVLEDTLVIRGEIWGRGNVRHTLGFGYPNTLALWGMVLVFALLLLDGTAWLRLAAGELLCIVFFLLTDSKAAFFSSLLAVILCTLTTLCGKKLSNVKWLPWVCAGLLLLTALGFVILSRLYREGSRFFELLNTIFSQRLGYSGQGLKQFGISLFGAHVDFGWDPVDSLYAYGPICLGLVPSLLYLGLAMLAVFRSAEKGKWDIVAVAIAGSLYCTMEYALINPIFLPVFAACALSDGEINPD